MEVEIVKSEKNFAEFIVKGERHTFSNLLRSRLLQDEDVSFASYILEHPLDNEAKFVVRTKSKSVKKALDEAVKKIEKELKEFESAVKKTVK